MKPYEEGDRLNYPGFTRDSLVLDIGGFEGNWSLWMSAKYGCEIHCFEPVPEFYANIAKRFAGHPKIHVHNYGIGGTNRTERWKWKGSMTGIRSLGDQIVEVEIRDVMGVLISPTFQRPIALMKINAEGSEFELLESLLGKQHDIFNIQIQWHSVVDDFAERRRKISEALSLTHELTWQDPNFDNGHENWAIK